MSDITVQPTVSQGIVATGINALKGYQANESLNFPDCIIFPGTKIDGTLGSVTITSSIEVIEKGDQWFKLVVGYLTSVKASNLDKSPLQIGGQNYKRPSEKLTIVKELISFNISRSGVISNTLPTNDWLSDSGLGCQYGAYVFPYLEKLFTRWENPLSLLFLLLFTSAIKGVDQTDLRDNGSANYKPIAYQALSLEQRLTAIYNHYQVLQAKNHPALGNFSRVANQAKLVLDKMEADRIAATIPQVTTPVDPQVTTDSTLNTVHPDGQVTAITA